MKKIVSFILATMLGIGLFGFSGCVSKEDDGKTHIVCTVFSVYDWVRETVGDTDDVEITLLLDSGADLHNYQPTVQDIAKIATCDLFVYVGGESDGWVDDALKNTKNPDLIAINFIEALGDDVLYEEETEEDASDDHDHDHDVPEEHIWLSLRNAKKLTLHIADQLAAIDADRAQAYRDNAQAFAQKLDQLDAEYAAAVESAKFDTLVFGDRFPFLYLFNDYNLKHYAAFSGCSAETEASFEMIVFLANKVDELNLPCIMTIEKQTHDIAQTVRNNTKTKDQQIYVLNSLQSVTAADVAAGASYLQMMQDNLAVLKLALN